MQNWGPSDPSRSSGNQPETLVQDGLLENFDFSRLLQGKSSSWFDAECGRDNRGNRVPRFRVPDRCKDLIFLGGSLLFLFFGSAPSGQEPLQV